ncbi:endonuclease/exonuclease/phosphatase family protein [Actinacidiphila alni]|uniref:endonuclease/exonuclease/phosphatase family protein n=1 Tax=Actinacidiphila alni TaxID=380248 RepID=UPI0033CE7AED
MTWNLWWRFGSWRERRTAILRTLEETRPDVVGLQEVWADPDENMAGWLAGELGMHWTWSRGRVQDRWHSRNGGDTTVDVGIAVLSRHPILATAERRLPAGQASDDGKTALHALIDTPAGPLPFFTTHLNSGPAESAVRCLQVRELAAFVARHTADGGHPPVVTGDFNAEPDFDEIRLMGGYKTAPAVPGLVLLDAWRFADPALPQGTWDLAHEDSVNFGARPTCLDYIFVGMPDAAGARGAIQYARRAGDRRIDGVLPSDHAAVIADLAHGAPAAP